RRLGEDLLGGAAARPEVYRLPDGGEHLLERRQRIDDVELGGIAHVAQAEELALHLSLPAGDRDVLPLRVRRDDLLAVDTGGRNDRGHGPARRGLGEERK